jgi:hypothetical protein
MLPNDYQDVFANPYRLLFPSNNYRDALPQLDLNAFPEISDFEIELYDRDHDLGPHLRFVSPSFGILTSFPWWYHMDTILTTTSAF